MSLDQGESTNLTYSDIVYILDHGTHFNKAGLVSSKKAEEVALLLNSKWFDNGMPRIKTLLTDNGTEYTGEDMRLYCNRRGIKHIISLVEGVQL